MSPLSFQKFIDATYVVAADLEGEGYIPTYVDPFSDEFLVLEGVPDDVSMQTAARNWARGMSAKDYFLGYQDGDEIVLEQYTDGQISETIRIEIPNTRIQ